MEVEQKIRPAIRKLTNLGDTRLISIPKDWIEQHGLGLKDPTDNPELFMLYDDVIVIFPPNISMKNRQKFEKAMLRFEEETKEDDKQ